MQLRSFIRNKNTPVIYYIKYTLAYFAQASFCYSFLHSVHQPQDILPYCTECQFIHILHCGKHIFPGGKVKSMSEALNLVQYIGRRTGSQHQGMYEDTCHQIIKKAGLA